MVVGVYVNVYAWTKKSRGGHCRVTYENIFSSLLMYFIFFILFANFFVNRYLRPASLSNFFLRVYNSFKCFLDTKKLI